MIMPSHLAETARRRASSTLTHVAKALKQIRNPSLLFLVAGCTLFAQSAATAVSEQVIRIQVTPADFAAVSTHRRAHTNGALRPEGGRHASRTFETDSAGKLVEVTSLAPSVAPAAGAAPTGAPPFDGPGFYPADLSLLVSNAGQGIVQSQVHNVYINCDASCFGYPAAFENNLFSSRFIHIVDQYVGSEDNGRYTLGPSLIISNYPIRNTLVTNPVLNYADVDAIIHAAASKFGSGYGHIYNIFAPKGVDYCNGYAPPYTFCFSPDNPPTWAECAEHDIDSFADIPGMEYATMNPYPDVFEVVNGAPFYGCDVGQPSFSTNTSPTPNGVVVDSISNALGHEIFETITDPDGTEWQAFNGYFGYTPAEIGDVCEIYYGTRVFTPFRLSGHLYEIQPMYSNKYHVRHGAIEGAAVWLGSEPRLI
jgi:hypothetical protein